MALAQIKTTYNSLNMSKNKITVQTTISANHAKVWDYYTNPQHITYWNFASSDWQCPVASNDMRVGGKYMARMEAKDGSFGFDFEAIYDEVIEEVGFTYTMGDGRQASATFEGLGDQTMVIINFDAESENSVEMQRNGWQAILDNFKNYVEHN